MHLTHLATLSTLATTLALPTSSNYTDTTPNTNTTTTNPSNFLLLTTPSSSKYQNTTTTTAPTNISLTSLFSPLLQTPYLLRLIGPGYNSLPRFNLTSSGTLETEAAGPHGIGEFEYNSTRVHAGEDLTFAPAAQPKGNLGLEGGFLLTVGGESEGWKVCEGDLGQKVVAWRGDDDSCTDTFVQAVQDAPY